MKFSQIRAAIRTFTLRERKYVQTDPKFKRRLFMESYARFATIRCINYSAKLTRCCLQRVTGRKINSINQMQQIPHKLNIRLKENFWKRPPDLPTD